MTTVTLGNGRVITRLVTKPDRNLNSILPNGKYKQVQERLQTILPPQAQPEVPEELPVEEGSGFTTTHVLTLGLNEPNQYVGMKGYLTSLPIGAVDNTDFGGELLVGILMNKFTFSADPWKYYFMIQVEGIVSDASMFTSVEIEGYDTYLASEADIFPNAGQNWTRFRWVVDIPTYEAFPSSGTLNIQII